MHDIKLIRDDPDAFDAGLKKRGLPPLAAELLRLDDERKAEIQFAQAAQERRNRISKEIGKAKAANDEKRVAELLAEMGRLKSDITNAAASQAETAAQRLNSALVGIPNIPQDDVPVGPDEKANVEIRRVGEPRRVNVPQKQHFEIGEALGLMDFETAAKLSGARFVVLKGALARLERALATFMLNLHTGEHGYVVINSPLPVRRETI